MIGALILAAIASTGLHLEESDVPLESALQVMTSLSRVITAETGVVVSLDDPSWSSCDARDRCFADIRARTGADDVVFVRVFAGPSKLHAVIERVTVEPGAPKVAEVDVPRNGGAAVDELLRRAVRVLYPDAKPPPLAVVSTASVAPPRASEVHVAPWIVIGAGVSAGVVGGIFGSLANGTRADLESGVHLERDYLELTDRMDAQALAANVLFGVAAVAVVAGVVWLIAE